MAAHADIHARPADWPGRFVRLRHRIGLREEGWAVELRRHPPDHATGSRRLQAHRRDLRQRCPARLLPRQCHRGQPGQQFRGAVRARGARRQDRVLCRHLPQGSGVLHPTPQPGLRHPGCRPRQLPGAGTRLLCARCQPGLATRARRSRCATWVASNRWTPVMPGTPSAATSSASRSPAAMVRASPYWTCARPSLPETAPGSITATSILPKPNSLPGRSCACCARRMRPASGRSSGAVTWPMPRQVWCRCRPRRRRGRRQLQGQRGLHRRARCQRQPAPVSARPARTREQGPVPLTPPRNPPCRLPFTAGLPPADSKCPRGRPISGSWSSCRATGSPMICPTMI